MSKIVAVIGASSNRGKFGNKALRAFERQGYTVIPINPNEPDVEGHRTYASVLDVPGTIDLATVYVPGSVGVKVVEELARKGVPEVWLNPGADDDEVVERARELVRFVLWVLNPEGGQRYHAALDYVPLEPKVMEKALASVGTISFQGQPVWRGLSR